jgi:hypothetical protein
MTIKVFGLLIIFIIINRSNLCFAQNILQTSFINGLVTLKAEWSPYVVREDLIINRNSKLVIEPGVELRFDKGKQLIVHGTLEAKVRV